MPVGRPEYPVRMKLQCASILVAGFFALPLLAQEGAATDDSGTLTSDAWPGMGSSRSSWTDRFDSAFNPAIGLAIDTTVLGGSAADGAAGLNRLALRSSELLVQSRIDPLGWAYLVGTFAAPEIGGEHRFELEEAAVILDQLPANLTLRAGRFAADIGKWNTVHQHDMPFLLENPVRGEYLGGMLLNTGVELHQWTGLGDLPLRWSLGLSSAWAGHGHDGGGHDHAHDAGEADFVGRRSLDNWAWTGRLTAQHDVGQNGYLQWGVGGRFAPAKLDMFMDEVSGESYRFETRQSAFVADLTLRTVDATGQSADTVGLELWRNGGELFEAEDGNGDDQLELAEAGILPLEDVWGVWGFWEHAFNPHWSAGLHSAWWQHAEAAPGGDWFAANGGEAGARYGAFLTWNLSEFNRLRLELLQHAPGDGTIPSNTIALQWTAILGSHSHPLDW